MTSDFFVVIIDRSSLIYFILTWRFIPPVEITEESKTGGSSFLVNRLLLENMF